MEIKITTNQILKVLEILSWIIFIGLCIEAGGITVCTFITLFIDPHGVENFWKGKEYLSGLYRFDQGHFIAITVTMIIVAVLKAIMFYLIVKLFTDKKVKISQPFRMELRPFIIKQSYLALGIGLFSHYGFEYSVWLTKQGVKSADLQSLHMAGGAYVWLFMAVILFVIVQVKNKSKGNNFVFKGLKIVAWVIFIGLCIEAGALIVNFIFSIYKPEFVPNLYQKLDLSEMHNRSKWIFFSMYSFILFISLLKAVLFYVVIILVSKIDLTKPFNSFVSGQIRQISYYTLSIGLLSYIARQTAENLQHRGYVIDNLNQFWADSQAYILMAAVIYVIATIFSKGVEIQNENDLTV
jgi:hypothetical protein